MKRNFQKHEGNDAVNLANLCSQDTEVEAGSSQPEQSEDTGVDDNQVTSVVEQQKEEDKAMTVNLLSEDNKKPIHD